MQSIMKYRDVITLITSAINAFTLTYFRMLLGNQFTKQKKELATEILVVLHFLKFRILEILIN